MPTSSVAGSYDWNAKVTISALAGLSSWHRYRRLAVPSIQALSSVCSTSVRFSVERASGPSNHINQLEPGRDLRMEGGAFDPRQKLRDAGNNISIRNQHTHAFGHQERIRPFTYRKADSIFGSRNTKDCFCLLGQEIGEVLLKHQCDTSQDF